MVQESNGVPRAPVCDAVGPGLGAGWLLKERVVCDFTVHDSVTPTGSLHTNDLQQDKKSRSTSD
ncbi:hypothetical protein R69749_07215 [Paraburkholderia domus]|uniref:Uncharacterized protein n=1 Tax=Paraburkholderia domus TaxID=2793075 RepID=A0A9N8NFP9_9BURK|nr:hypothetical protein R70006_07232 [Paraburkholderia domus]CAE6884058.1 hypothetical protein R69749_07215 [Paraburkholderia domus]CAE6960174.1 hypothetical protein R70199_07259 [Paraburkholderia domus]CAE6965099.1 hypothetical protein R70211_07277 [Paraburkholderia domus]